MALKRSTSASTSGPATDRSHLLMPYVVGFFAVLWSSALVVDAVTTGVGSTLRSFPDTTVVAASMMSTSIEPVVRQQGLEDDHVDVASEGRSFWMTVLRVAATCFTTLFSEFLQGFIVCILVIAVVCCLSPSRTSNESRRAVVRIELEKLDKAD